jgi:hypothetical protein
MSMKREEVMGSSPPRKPSSKRPKKRAVEPELELDEELDDLDDVDFEPSTPSNARREPSKVSQWTKVATSLAGDDEFSVFSVDAPRTKKPVEMAPEEKGRPHFLHSEKSAKEESIWTKFRRIFDKDRS